MVGVGVLGDMAGGVEQLHLDRDEVSLEILERAKSGFLGIGSSPAKVKVTYEAPDEPEIPAPAPAAEAPKAAPAPVKEPVREEAPAPAAEEAPAAAAPAGEDPRAARIVSFLTGLLEHMNVKATPVVTPMEGGYRVVLEGEDLGALIGRRGETLDAIQQLTSYSVNRGASHRVRIHLDAENYRAKREESLVRLARKMAGKAVKYRKNMMLEPMNAYERHVIHTALQDYPDVTTYSTGTEPNRRTVVAYSPGEHR